MTPEPATWTTPFLGPTREADVVYDHSGNVTWRVVGENAVGYLKVGADLGAEADALGRLGSLHGEVGGMRIPELLAFEAGADGGEDRLLTAEVPGRDLTHLVDDPARVVRMLADALLKLHSAPIDLLGVVEEGGGGRSNLVIVHGDACLPNILVDDAGERPIGLVDVGDMRIGRAEEDLAAACWSIGFNIGIEWGGAFLGHYDWPHTDQDTVQALADAYGT